MNYEYVGILSEWPVSDSITQSYSSSTSPFLNDGSISNFSKASSISAAEYLPLDIMSHSRLPTRLVETNE